MISKGKRQEGNPFIISENSFTKLDRIPLNQKKFSEEWIQRVIHDNPELLPVEEIEGNFSPLIPIGREVSTKVGNIDNLFISPDGHLTIVETKLWRNPEARREVVGQIIDYAKELSKWTISDLDEAVKAYNKRYNANADGLLSTINKFDPIDVSDESLFYDNISKNLKKGRFLLLIVGDGIRESVEDMVDYLSQTPQLYFTLSLIELQVYMHNIENDSFLVVPNIIMRTKDVIRSVIKVENKCKDDVSVIIENFKEDENGTKGPKRFTITEEEYFEQLEDLTDKQHVEWSKQIITDGENKGYLIEWAQGSFVVKLPDPAGSNIKITLLVVTKYGTIYLGWSAGQLKKLGIDEQLTIKYVADTATYFKNCFVPPNRKSKWNREVTFSEFMQVYDQFMKRMEQFVDEIKNYEEKV
jgi:hypothetical protein